MKIIEVLLQMGDLVVDEGKMILSSPPFLGHIIKKALNFLYPSIDAEVFIVCGFVSHSQLDTLNQRLVIGGIFLPKQILYTASHFVYYKQSLR